MTNYLYHAIIHGYLFLSHLHVESRIDVCVYVTLDIASVRYKSGIYSCSVHNIAMVNVEFRV